MKDFNEILSHVNAIGEIDQLRQSGGFERRRAVGALACHIADELVAGRPAPCVENAERFTRIDGMLPSLANELVKQHDMAIAHRTHLAERLETDGGENGAKAAAILRAMNAPAEPSKEDEAVKVSVVSASDVADTVTSVFAGLQSALYEAACGIGKDLARHADGNASDLSIAEQLRCGMTKNELERVRPQLSSLWGAWVGNASEAGEAPPVVAAPGLAEALAQDQRIKRYRAMEDERRVLGLAKDAQDQAKRIEEAELRGFYKGRGKALEIVFAERNKWGLGDPGDVRDVLARVSESICYMQKEG